MRFVRRCLGIVCAVALSTGCAAHVHTGLVGIGDGGGTELTEADRTYPLRGPLARELARVDGARVKLWASGGNALRVLAYQILDIGNGFAAYVGWIRVDQGGVRLVESSGRAWTLAGVGVEEFRDLHDTKVWVTGLEEGGDLLRPFDWGALEGAAAAVDDASTSGGGAPPDGGPPDST